MANRLQPLNLTSFVGGLNLRRNQFQLAEDESPDLLNIDIDPRGGFYTRRGWRRWQADDTVDPEVVTWAPRNAFMHPWSTGEQQLYVVNETTIWWVDDLGVSDDLTGITAQASPHGADFMAWGDLLYFVTGRLGTSYRRTGTGAPAALDPDNWSEIEAPVSNVMPQAEFIESHADYAFVANTREGATNFPNRIRWSHPNTPDSFREGDYLDINVGGNKITGILSFQDHLLIFKESSLWALYGYEDESFQLVMVSDRAGAPNMTSTTRSESAVFYYSQYDRGGIYVYSGNGKPDYLSERLSTAFEQVFSQDNVFVSWAGRRLWVAVPWTKDDGSTAEPSTCFVFDSTVGEGGAWTMYRSAVGAVATVLDGANVNSKFPLATFWSERAATFVTLDIEENAYDDIALPSVLGTEGGDDIVTDLDLNINVNAEETGDPFDSYYRTRWLHAGWPDRKKSWRRPTFICRQVSEDVELIVESFRNYDQTSIHRSRRLTVTAGGTAMWTEGGSADADEGGFDWSSLGAADPDGTGADWASATGGSSLVRSGSLGLARSIQMLVKAAPSSARRKWGVDGIVAKLVMRRFR